MPIRRLAGYARRHAAALLLAGGLAGANALMELARPWPMKVLLDDLLPGRPLPAPLGAVAALLPGGGSAAGRLWWLVAVGVGLVAGAAVLSLLVQRVVVRVSQALVYDLSRDVFAKVQRLSLGFHSRHTVGDLLQRVGGDVFAAYAVVAQVALPGSAALLTVVGMAAVMFRLDAALAWLAVAVVPLLAGALALFARPMTATVTRQWEQQGALMAFVEQSLSAIKVVQGFARERYVQAQLERRARDLGDTYGASTRVGAAYNQVTAAITGVAAALMLGVGGARVLDGRLTVGGLFVFLAYVAALYAPVNALTTAIGAALTLGPRVRRVVEILDAVDELPEAAGALALERARGEVVFEGVTFGYAAEGGGRRAVLRDVSLTVQAGQVVAVVGATGAGKSSLVALLSRFYDPWEGRVCLDGHDLRDLTLRSLRENVALVLQEPYLFPMSVADNIGFGNPDAPRARVEAAARAARAHDFIVRLPEGYDTVVGERGGSLSGGERQRISIARALLKDAPILVLDEPTSALDAETEAQIFDGLSALMRGRTTFIISHRLTTIRRADLILAIEDGRIVERGTHETLLAGSEVYARLYRHQYVAAL
jgi:ABC-type multidrug transport system fused ATPase/permease subunit